MGTIYQKKKRKKKKFEFTAVFNSEIKSMSTLTMQRELNGLRLKSRVYLGKPLITKADLKKASILGSLKIIHWNNRKRSCDQMRLGLPCSRGFRPGGVLKKKVHSSVQLGCSN